MVMIPVDVYKNILGGNHQPNGSQFVGNGENIVEPSPRNLEDQKSQQKPITFAEKKRRGKVRKKTSSSSNTYKRHEGKRYIRNILKRMSKKQLSAIISHRQ